MLSASSRRRRNRAPRGIGIDVALGGLPGGGRGALRDRRKTAIDAAAVDRVDLDAHGMAWVVGLRGCRRCYGQARTKHAREQNRIHDAAHDRSPPLSRNQAQCCRGWHQIATLPANCRQSPLPRRDRVQGNARGCALAYKMIAERDNEKCSFARESRLLIVAKAKVWASEGWKVVITDQDGKAYAPPEFDQLLAA
jgi:hypothetical protein